MGKRTASPSPAPSRRVRTKPTLSTSEKCNIVAKEIPSSKELPAEVSQMLARPDWAACLGVYKDQRNEWQQRVVDVIGDVLKEIELSKVADAEANQAKLDGAAADKIRRQHAEVDSHVALGQLKATLVQRRIELENDTVALDESQIVYAQAKEAQIKGDADGKVTMAKKARLEVASKDINSPITDAKAAKQAVKSLVAIAKDFGFDEALVKFMHLGTVGKDPSLRSPFDELMFQHLNAEFEKRIAELTAIVNAGESARAARAVAREASQTAFNSAKEKKEASTKALKDSRVAVKAGEAAVHAAEKAVIHFQSELRATTQGLEHCKAALDVFRTKPLSAYTELKDSESPPPPHAEPEVVPEPTA